MKQHTDMKEAQESQSNTVLVRIIDEIIKSRIGWHVSHTRA